jgi:hypothetical protein
VFDSPYKFEKRSSKKVDKSNLNFLCVWIYTFTTHSGTTYIVELNEYKGNIFVLKFYPKKFRISENRYSLCTNEYDAPRILRTCLAIGEQLYEEKQGKICVAFMGARSPDEPLLYRTKRWEVYRKFVTRFFGKESFEHVMSEQTSSYILISKLMENYVDLVQDVPRLLLDSHPELIEQLTR